VHLQRRIRGEPAPGDSFRKVAYRAAWHRIGRAGCGTLCVLLIACAAADAPPTPTTVDSTTHPTQSIAAGTGPQSAAATALPTPETSALTAAVRRGTIEEIVTLAGQVVGRNDLPIAASAVTQTRRIYVAPGRMVSEGQPLIETEGTDRQRRTDEIRGREQAAARRAEAAQTRLQERQRQVTEELSRLPQPGALTAEVQLAQSAVLQARVGLQRAEADLSTLTAPPRAVDIQVADQQIRTADLALQRAEADRERVLDGPSDAELRQAEDEVAAAEAEVRRAVDALQKVAGGPDAAKVEAARRTVLLAQTALQIAHQAPPEILSAQALVRAARNRSSRERREAQSAARQQVELALARQRLDIQRAEADLGEAFRALQDVSRGPETEEVEVASRDVQAALRKLESSREHLAVLQSGPPQIEIDAANASVEAARATLEQSQARRAALNVGPPAGQVTAARAAVTSARAAFASADARASELTSQQLRQEQDVSQARAQIDLLRGIQSGAVHAPDEAAKPGADPDIVEFAEAQKELAEARAEVGTVDGGPDATTLVAPTAGMVTAVLTGPGEETGPNRPAVVMVKTGDLVAQVSLETPAGSRILPGMSARVRLFSVPGTDLAATVDRVDATPGNRAAQLSVAWSSPLPTPGAQVQALVPLHRREGALLVPTAAIRTDGHRKFVDIVQGTTTQRVEVSTGLDDGTDVEILGGVQEGQFVVVGT
jgi:hypothetical protein